MLELLQENPKLHIFLFFHVSQLLIIKGTGPATLCLKENCMTRYFLLKLSKMLNTLMCMRGQAQKSLSQRRILSVFFLSLSAHVYLCTSQKGYFRNVPQQRPFWFFQALKITLFNLLFKDSCFFPQSYGLVSNIQSHSSKSTL